MGRPSPRAARSSRCCNTPSSRTGACAFRRSWCRTWAAGRSCGPAAKSSSLLAVFVGDLAGAVGVGLGHGGESGAGDHADDFADDGAGLAALAHVQVDLHRQFGMTVAGQFTGETRTIIREV